MAYKHGVYTQEAATGLVPPRAVDSAVPVVFGTAPGPKKGTLPINEPVLCYKLADFVEAFGMSDDWKNNTLCEFATAYFSDYNLQPAVFINVYDPKIHGMKPPLKMITGKDIIGGVNAETGKKTGFALLDEVFPRFRIVPGQVVSPHFSSEPSIAISMASAAKSINGLFKAIALVDIPTAVSKIADVPQFKEKNNLTAENMVVCWPKVKKGDKVYHMSTHLAGLIARTDADAEGIPYKSPSNRRFEITGACLDTADSEVFLGLDEANYLNGNGIVTALNFDGGWKCWGNRTGIYPSVTDPKDAFLPIKRFFYWHSNTFILTYFQKVDFPLTKRLLETIMDSENCRLNSFAAREIILGGRIEFQEDENPLTDLMDGLIRFHTYITPPSPARAIINTLEYDPKYLSALFG